MAGAFCIIYVITIITILYDFIAVFAVFLINMINILLGIGIRYGAPTKELASSRKHPVAHS